MQKKKLRAFLTILLICCFTDFAQDNYTISGYVQDESSGESLIGVSIYDKNTYKGTTTNQYGFYSLTLPKDNMILFFHSLDLSLSKEKLDLSKDLRLNISLKNNAIVTDEVIVTGERLDKNVSSSDMSQAKIEVDNIKQLPVILGEVDVLKSAQLLPGIQSRGEGNSGLYVRGGGPDQNLS